MAEKAIVIDTTKCMGQAVVAASVLPYRFYWFIPEPTEPDSR